MATPKVAPPLTLAKVHKLLLTLLSWDSTRCFGDAALDPCKSLRVLAHPLELVILRGILDTLKVAPPLLLAKTHEHFLTLLSW